MVMRRKGLLFFHICILIGSLFHFLTLTVSGNAPSSFWLPVLASGGYLAFRYRSEFFRSYYALTLMTASILVSSTIADHLLNAVPFETNIQIQTGYKQFQSLMLLTLPILVAVYGERSKDIKSMLVFGLCLQLLPPYSYAMMTQFLVPSYGRIVVLFYILMTLPGTSIRLDRRILAALALVPLVALPSLFYGHSPGNTIDHIVTSLLFVLAAMVLSTLSASSTDRLINLVVATQALHVLFSILIPGLHAINNNMTAMGAEGVMILALYRFARGRGLSAVLTGTIITVAVLILMIRIEATTGLVATLAGASIYLYMQFLHDRFPASWRPFLLPAGLTLTIASALYYLLLVSDNSSIQIRRLLWELTLSGTMKSGITTLLGTGDFGPHHFFLFRHLNRDLLPSEMALIQSEPHTIGQHPHNDFLLMLYGGGLLFSVLSGFLFLRTFLSSLIKNTPVSAMSAALMGSIIIHGLTEPYTTSPATGFLFFTGIVLYWKQFSEAPIRIGSSVSIPVSLALLFLMTMVILHAPIVHFWKENTAVLFEIQSDQKVSPLQTERLNAAASALKRIELLTLLQPWESDLFRQRGDLLTAVASTTGGVQEFQTRFDVYCTAFKLRSSPIHLQRLKNAHLSTYRNRQCLGMSMDKLEKSYDPYGLVHFLQTVPGGKQ